MVKGKLVRSALLTGERDWRVGVAWGAQLRKVYREGR
jgi:hypothetical protein